MKASNRLHAAIMLLLIFSLTLLTSCFPMGHAPRPGNYNGNNGNHGQKMHHDNGNHNGQNKQK